MWCRVSGATYEPEFVMAPVTGINANILISGDYPGDFECFADKIVKRFMLDNTTNNNGFNIRGDDDEEIIPLTKYPYEEIMKSKQEVFNVSGPMAELKKAIDEGHLYDDTTVTIANGHYGLIRIGKSQHIYTGKKLLNFIEWDNFVPVIDLFAGAIITEKVGNTAILNEKLEAGRYVILLPSLLDPMVLQRQRESWGHHIPPISINLLNQIDVKISRKSLRGNTALKSNITKEKNTATNDSRVSRRF
jgi:hypothetical protein